jgi:hypothetical protein
MDRQLHRIKRSIQTILLCALLFSVPARNEGVVFYSTGDPNFNTTPPTGVLASSGWALQGFWDVFLGTPISSNYFLTAKHVGGALGSNFTFQGTSYRTIGKFDHPNADLTLWRVAGEFTNFASLYTNSNEVSRPLVVFGRGRQRGPGILRSSELKGWEWGIPDSRLRWGENTVAAIIDQRAQLLRATFDTDASPNEAHLSNGDSGGAVFIEDGGIWKLAGINFAVDGRYNTNTVGKGFDATLFDERGFYRGSEDEWELQSDGAEIQPGGFYSTRISTYANWIRNVAAYGNPKGEMFLEHSSFPEGPFTTDAAAKIDGETQTIRISLPPAARFYRLRSSEPARIASIAKSPGGIVLTFE